MYREVIAMSVTAMIVVDEPIVEHEDSSALPTHSMTSSQAVAMVIMVGYIRL